MRVEELLAKEKIEYTPKGQDLLIRCLNPEHEDNNPSLRIDKITGIFNCLSCGFKGSLFKHFGEKPNADEILREKLKDKIRQKMSETIGLEMPPDSVPYEGNWRDISPETYKKFEAFQNADSHFIGRICFPIRDTTGRIVVFTGRHTTMSHNPKYLHYPRGIQLPFFPQVKPILGSVILVEGLFDMLNLHDKGLTNAICAFGTNTSTVAKLQLLSMQGVRNIDIMFDSDEPGQNAAAKVTEMCEKAGLQHRNINLNSGDPGDLSESAVIKLKEKLYGESSNN